LRIFGGISQLKILGSTNGSIKILLSYWFLQRLLLSHSIKKKKKDGFMDVSLVILD